MADAYIVRRGGSMGNKSVVIVTGPTGSTVTLEKNGKVKNTLEKNGAWTFRNIENGTWTLKARLGSEYAEQGINVSQFDVYRVSFGYVFLMDTIVFQGGMAKGRDYEVFRDNGSIIPVSSYGSEKNWNLEIYTTQPINFTKQGKIDIFMVGAGGNGGGPNYATGGAGGYAKNEWGQVVNPGPVQVVIGAAPGGSTSFAGYSVGGGESGGEKKPANGGSGGGGWGGGSGGTNGGDGTGNNAGKGAGWSTKAFGTGKLYAGGGGGYLKEGNNGGAGGGAAGGRVPEDAAPNTGGGGGGSGGNYGSRGGSGIVIIRNAR